MNSLFKEELDVFVLVYHDDILAFLQMLENHIRHIKIGLQKMRDAKSFARLHKCSFFQEKVEYLGFDVSRNAVQPSLEKVRTFVEWLQSQFVKEIHSFLGLAGFYRRFICTFSLKARPLTDLTKDGVRWRWTETEEQAFSTAQEEFSDSTRAEGTRFRAPLCSDN